jgi:hypothetical protein
MKRWSDSGFWISKWEKWSDPRVEEIFQELGNRGQTTFAEMKQNRAALPNEKRGLNLVPGFPNGKSGLTLV